MLRLGTAGRPSVCLMWERNRLSLRRPKFQVTTGSDRRRPLYLNRARDLMRSHIHQVRVADIIYIDSRPSPGMRRSQSPPVRPRDSLGAGTRASDDPALTRVAIALELKQPASGSCITSIAADQ